jgi:hypothetical protein
MSNRAALIGWNTLEPHGPCDYATHVLCGASNLVPAFWLCCFDESDIRYVDIDGDRVPLLFTETGVARQRCAQRGARVLDTFAAHADLWPQWLALLNGCEFARISEFIYEVWMMMDPAEFDDNLVRALRWFDTGTHDDREGLFWLSSIERNDAARRAIVHDRRECPCMFLQGYGEVRPVPWDDE